MTLPASLPPGALPEYDPDGHDVINRQAIGLAVAGGTSIAAGAVNTAITSVPGTGQVQFLQSLRLVCTTTPGGAGNLSLKDQTGGTVLLVIPVAASYVAGQVLEYRFPVPLRSVGNFAFAAATAAGTGTWMWFPEGFVMNTAVIV